jgi:sporulation protein YlmC with PRC-barrel domain
MEMNSFYLSRVLGSKVFIKDNNFIGNIKDFGVINTLKNPKIEAVKIKTPRGIINFKCPDIFVKKQNDQYIVIINNIEDVNLEHVTFLAKHVLDKQIIDVNGRKIVRVNDIRLLNYGTNVFVVAADIGAQGILRRIGIAKPIVRMGFKLSSKLILWNDIAKSFKSNESIMLSKTYNKLSIIHLSDLAEIIEDFDENTGMMIFSSLDNAKVDDVLQEIQDNKQLNFIKSLDTDKVADIQEEILDDQAADIMHGLSELKAKGESYAI